MRKSIPMLDNTKHLRGGRRPPRSLIGMSFRPGIPWQVALQQSLPPLSQPPPFCKTNGVPVEQFSAGGSCLTLVVSQKGPQSTKSLFFGNLLDARSNGLAFRAHYHFASPPPTHQQNCQHRSQSELGQLARRVR